MASALEPQASEGGRWVFAASQISSQNWFAECMSNLFSPMQPLRAAGFSSLLFPDLDADLVRDPSRRTSSISCTGEFISLTTGRRLVFESAGERDLLIMLDVDYRTVNLVSQPERWKVHNGRKWTSYVPDIFAASIHNERTYFQVKTRERIETDPTLKGRLDAIIMEAARRNADHRFCPREALRVGSRLSNARRIHACATAIVFPHVRLVHALLGQFRSPCRLGDLRSVGLNPDLENCLLGLVGHRALAIRLAATLDDELEIHW